MKAAILGLIVLAAAPAAAQNSLDDCTTLSFAPLDMNIPACTALIENSGGFSQAALGAIHAARAEAYEFALTYHGEHAVDPNRLLAAALADLDKAVAADARYTSRRGEILFRLSRFAESAADYTAAIARDPASAPGLLERRSHALAAANDVAGAIEDMTAAIRLVPAGPERTRFLVRRAELLENAGNSAGAVADYRAALAASPGHTGARQGLDRLGAGAPG